MIDQLELKHYQTLLHAMANNNMPMWLHDLREQQFNQFIQQGFPTRRDEDWKYTNITSLSKTPIQLPQATSTVMDDFVHSQLLPNSTGHVLVFINGHFSNHYSRIPPLPNNVILTSLRQACLHHADIAKQYLTLTEQNTQRLFALNTALMTDGLFLYLPKNTVITAPIQLLFLSTSTHHFTLISPRNLIIAEANTQVTVLEEHVATNDYAYFNNTAMQIFAGNNAQINYYKLQRESSQASHIASTQIQQAHDSQILGFNIALGGQLARDDLNILLNANGAHCQLHGLYIVGAQQHIDHHTRIDHLAPHTASNEYYKGIIGEQGTGVFNGKILVHPPAQKTNAQLANKNLLLAKTAEVNTKPELEIYADDVKCAHGTTVGQIEDDLLFYLRSRGIDKDTALQLLTYAFASEIIDKITSDAIKQKIHGLLSEKLATLSIKSGD